MQPADAGEILVDGNTVNFRSVRDAQDLGIALIHQELNLASNLNVAANVFLGREPTKFGGILSRRKMNKSCKPWLERLGLTVSPKQLVEDLAIGQRQLVEIAKALSMGAKVLIMDEPTSSLSQRETDRLLAVIGELRNEGVSIVYISHRLGEIREIADRVTVLRDGENAGDLAKDEITHDAMVRLMVGRDISQYYPRTKRSAGNVVLQARQIRTTAFPDQTVDLEIRAGEIVGLAGLVGAGRSELLETIFGGRKALGGTVRVCGKDVMMGRPDQAIAASVAFNEEATRLSGVRTDRIVILAYVVCAMLAGFAGMMFAVDVNSVQPSSHGNFYELYAIAAAVLGGCSLRGGEGAVLGVIFGAAILRVLYNAINILGIKTEMEFAVIGVVILAGVIADELIKRWAASRQLKST